MQQITSSSQNPKENSPVWWILLWVNFILSAIWAILVTNHTNWPDYVSILPIGITLGIAVFDSLSRKNW